MNGRLYDKVMAGTLIVAGRSPERKALAIRDAAIRDAAIDMLRGCVVIDANDVADYHYQQSAQDWHDVTKDFPNLAPPYEKMFFEFKQPIHMNIGGVMTEVEHGQPRLVRTQGVCLSYAKIPDDKMGGWALGARWFMETVERKLLVFDWATIFHVNQSGLATGRPVNVSPYGEDLPSRPGVFPTTFVAFQAVCFMHCKNAVQIIDNKPNPEKSEAHRQKHGRPLCEHKTLVVKPVRKMRELQEAAQARGDVNFRLHQVRGHFKRYTAEAPLLGKHVGTYFWADQLRGDPDLGVIEKDYRIETLDTAPAAR